MKLVENMLIKYSDKRIIRVLYFDKLNKNLVVIDLFQSKWPDLVSLEKIEEDINGNKAEIVEDDIFCEVRNIKLSEAEIQGRDMAFEILSYIFKEVQEPEIYFTKYRTPQIKLAAEQYGVSFNTIKNYLIKYWKSGKIKNGLIPQFHKRGGRGIEKKTGDTKRGRPRVYGDKTGGNIDEHSKKLFRAGLNKFYFNDRQNTLRVAYELTLSEYFVKEYINKGDKKVPVMVDDSRMPTYNQFYYWYKKQKNERKEISTRQGERIFNQNYRGIIGNSLDDGELGPSSLWQIDSTIADVYLVSSLNRNLIIGRPVLYFVIDVYSRMIVGMNVTLESFNAYIGAMMALINAMVPKNEYCSKYGIDIQENPWDVSCVPQRILADRGEVMSGDIEYAIANLGISIQQTPPYAASSKGIIEASFRLANLKLQPFLDGVVVNGKLPRQRGEKDYRLKSNLTLEEFTKIVIKCVLFHNNHHVLSEYVSSEMMIEDSLEKIPSKIWQHGLENKVGMLRQLPEDVIRMNLLPHDEAIVTARGVSFMKLLYASKNSLKENWYQKARIEGSFKISVSYDPRDLTNIYYINEDGRSFEKLTLLKHLSNYANLDAAELQEIIRHEKENEIRSKDVEMGKKIELFNEIQAVVESAREESRMQKDHSLSKSQRLKNIRENRESEKEHHREAIVLDSEDYDDGEQKKESIARHNKDYDELDLFRQIQSEEWGDSFEQ